MFDKFLLHKKSGRMEIKVGNMPRFVNTFNGLPLQSLYFWNFAEISTFTSFFCNKIFQVAHSSWSGALVKRLELRSPKLS